MKRAVAYCRVSSDHKDQLSSLKNQEQYWNEYIQNKKDLEFVNIYVDEGISGTSTLKRKAFNQMLEDAKNKQFDIVLTKEVSRFARNIVDTLNYTRKLKEYGVTVFFESDNIDTGDNDGELRLSLMATLAQEESRKTSQRVKWGHKKAMQNGVVFGANRVLGYDLVNKTLVINESEAKIVKKIYDLYVYDNCSLHEIVRILEKEMNFTSGKIGGRINHTSIKRILENEKYVGDLKQMKTYTKDFLTHEIKKNEGEVEFVMVKGNHEAIINKETWEKAQFKLEYNRTEYKEKRKGYSRGIFSNKIICVSCGSKYRKRTLKNKDGSPKVIYKCNTNYNNGLKGCENGSYIRENMLKDIMIKIVENLLDEDIKNKVLNKITEIYKKIIANNENEKSLKDLTRKLTNIQNKKQKLLDLYIDGEALIKDEYNRKNEELQKAEVEIIKGIEFIQNKQLFINKQKEKIDMFIKSLNDIKNNFNFDNQKSFKDFVDLFVEKIEIRDSEIIIYSIIGNFNDDLCKYPKRVSNGNYTTIMVFKHEIEIDRIIMKFFKEYNVQILMHFD